MVGISCKGNAACFVSTARDTGELRHGLPASQQRMMRRHGVLSALQSRA